MSQTAPESIYHNEYACLQSSPLPSSLPDKLVCDICQELHQQKSLLFLCEVCLVPVHQFCYGLELTRYSSDELKAFKVVEIEDAKIISKGWTCQRCKEGHDNPEDKACILCRKTKGCITKTVLSGEEVWMHLQCMHWQFHYSLKKSFSKGTKQELVRDESYDEFIRTYEIAKVCQYCKEEGIDVLFCDTEGCKASFCARCATSEGIIQGSRIMKKFRHPVDKGSYLFCPDHCEEGALKLSKSDFKNFKSFKMLMVNEIKQEVPEKLPQESPDGKFPYFNVVKDEIVEDQLTKDTNIPQELCDKQKPSK